MVYGFNDKIFIYVEIEGWGGLDNFSVKKFKARLCFKMFKIKPSNAMGSKRLVDMW